MDWLLIGIGIVAIAFLIEIVIQLTIKPLEGKMSELGDALKGISDQLTKAQGEIVKKISDLETALSTAGGIPEDAQVALDALKKEAQALDDIVPDAPAV